MSAWNLLLRCIAIVGGALSCIALASQGFELNLGAQLLGLVDSWDALLRMILGWLIPHLLAALRYLGTLVGWDLRLQLHPHWSHILTVVWLYYLRDTSNFRELIQQEKEGNADAETLEGLRRSQNLSYSLGFGVALCSGVASGLVDPSSGRFWDQFQVALYPVLGFVVYALCMYAGGASWGRKPNCRRLGKPDPGFWPFFGYRAKLTALRFLIALSVIAACLYWFAGQPSPYLVGLSLVWVLLALEWLRRGWGQARDAAAKGGLPIGLALMKEGNINLGTNMLATVGLAAILLFADRFLQP